jgi:hypothetical protein
MPKPPTPVKDARTTDDDGSVSIREHKVSDGVRGFTVWEVTEEHEPPGGSLTYWEVRSEAGNVRGHRFTTREEAEREADDPG